RRSGLAAGGDRETWSITSSPGGGLRASRGRPLEHVSRARPRKRHAGQPRSSPERVYVVVAGHAPVRTGAAMRLPGEDGTPPAPGLVQEAAGAPDGSSALHSFLSLHPRWSASRKTPTGCAPCTAYLPSRTKNGTPPIPSSRACSSSALTSASKAPLSRAS